MKKHPFFLFIIAFLSFLLWSCGGEKMHSHEQMAAADTGSWASAEAKASSESESTPLQKTPGKQFIRTAEIRGKVANVETATYAIEKMVRAKGGFIVESRLNRDEDRHFSTEISPDSSLSVSSITVSNRISLRIPHTEFDSSLYSIARMFTVLEHRTIKADEVSFQILRNQLTQKRVRKHEKRLDKLVDTRPGKVDEALTGEDAILSLGEQGDEAFVQNLSLEDQVQYSTVTVDIYQKQIVEREMNPNLDNVDAFEPSFFQQAWQSLAFSWELLEELTLFLLKFWWLLGLALCIFLWSVGRKKGNVLPS